MDRELLILKQVALKAAANACQTGNTLDVLAMASDFNNWLVGTVSAPAPATQAPPPQSPVTPAEGGRACPTCGGETWDNRPKKLTGEFKQTAPDFKCKNKDCGGVIWPPR